MASLGQQEQAFQEWWLRYSQQVYVDAPPRKGWMVDVARTAFDAGVKHREGWREHSKVVKRLWHWLKSIPFLVEDTQRSLRSVPYGRQVEPLPREESAYSCYYVTIHFASAEEAARFINNRLSDRFDRSAARLQRGGEKLRMCKP